MNAQPDNNIVSTSDELEIQRMEGEGCPNTGPFFWELNEEGTKKAQPNSKPMNGASTETTKRRKVS